MESIPSPLVTVEFFTSLTLASFILHILMGPLTYLRLEPTARTCVEKHLES